MRFRALLLSLVAAVALPLLTTAVPAGAEQPTPTTAVGDVRIDGAVAAPRTVTLRELRSMPSQYALVRYTSGGAPERHVFRGVLLTDVLATARPAFDPAVRNDALGHAVLATAADGYRAAVAWGEIDPTFAGTRVLLAYEQDFRPLARPRLVVPGDERGGRYVTDVTEVTLQRLG